MPAKNNTFRTHLLVPRMLKRILSQGVPELQEKLCQYDGINVLTGLRKNTVFKCTIYERKTQRCFNIYET